MHMKENMLKVWNHWCRNAPLYCDDVDGFGEEGVFFVRERHQFWCRRVLTSVCQYLGCLQRLFGFVCVE